MQTALSVLGYIVLSLSMLAGLVITPLGLPGNWVILGSAVAYGFATHWAKFGWLFIVSLAAAALVGEVIEALSSAIGAKKFGASTGATVAAIVGSIVGLGLGTGVFPLIGTLVGAFAGAFLGAFIYEYIRLGDREQALQAGLGAFLGRTAAVIAKEAIGILMVGLIVYQIFTGGA
jgi:uncharacterized protein YqgC (DUF456 family)